MITCNEANSKAYRFSFSEGGQEIARAYLYVIRNDLHVKPYGLLEDVWVSGAFRGKGVATKLVKDVISKAKEECCYKVIATSRLEKIKVHSLYLRIGFALHGYEFRMEF